VDESSTPSILDNQGCFGYILAVSNVVPSGAADLVLRNGRIHRVPGDPAPAEAMAVRDGSIIALGATRDVEAAVRPGTRSLDLQGRIVTPAFTDSHTHAHRWAVLRYLHLDFEALEPSSIEQVLEHVRRRASETTAGTWIQGDSLTQGALAEGRFPDRHELDAAAPDHPVLLRGIGKHVVAANSAALAAAGITRETPDPPGGRIDRDAQGEPTGILHERAKLRLDQSDRETVVPAGTQEERLTALRAGMSDLHRHGITTIHEMVRLTEEADDWAVLRAAGELDVRVRLFHRVWESPISLDWLIGLGIRRGLGDDWLRVEGVKLSVDGWCIFRNAAVHEPYAGEPENTGILRIEPAQLNDLVARANRQGLGIAVHAVGARAVDIALDALEAAGPAVAGPHRIEHAHIDVDAPRLRRMLDLGLVWSAQPGLLPPYRRDWEAGLGADRAAGIMRLRTGLDLGLPMIFNSDVPSGPVGPLAAIRAAVTREADGRPLGPDQAFPKVEAWRAFTTKAAEVTGERVLGRLEAGYRADLVVLEGDPFGATDARTVAIAATMVDGRIVHDPAGMTP
jgi:predicted amidohydrolase YtcJ